MTRPADSLRWLGVGVVLLLHVVLYWYPFSVDPPRHIDNTARRLADGAWQLDAASRVMMHLPVMQPEGTYSISIAARPAHGDQTGPARLVSVGSNPYEPSLMIGMDRADVVVRLPCADGQNDAEWRVPGGDSPELSVTFWPIGDGAVTRPRLAVNERAPVDLQDQCPMDRRALESLLSRRWTLGNVRSGHRPFVGQITRLDLTAGNQRIDLLRESTIETPASYWLWPERLYQPDGIREPGHWAVALWHFLGFLVLAVLLEAGQARSTARRTMLVAAALSATLFAGKFLIVGRHPAIGDLMLNVGGAATGIFLHRRLRRDSGETTAALT